ncbi:hypothetical protein [Geothrix sp. SG200]|uniref:hypothetical protein n=1 Tax=Geothrix sp. SG200 TaxID=2922865 RepID=UPI001FAD87EE|nr:hypothetical protein [Geothrix sp. SG200]
MAIPLLLPLLLVSQSKSVGCNEEVPRLHPIVLEMKPPVCPPMVRLSGISGTAKFLVKTDGHKIQEILKSEGPPMLQRQIPPQLMTWRFEDHAPTEFTITFKITVVFRDPCASKRPEVVKMALPSSVDITTYSVGECDPVVTQSKAQ